MKQEEQKQEYIEAINRAMPDWVGPKKDAANRRKVLKWVPPVLVGENCSKLRDDVNIVVVD